MSDPIPIIQENSLRATDSGFELQVRFKWYRSLPLSCVEDLRLSLDGRPVDPASLRFGINGHTYRLEELVGLVEEEWFIIDPAHVIVEQPGLVNSGEAHQVDVAFGMRIPYIAIGPEKFLTIINRQSVTQTAA
jgi:hypothetical protein